MRKNALFLASCFIGAASYLVAAPKTAEARYKRVPGTECTVDLQSYNIARMNSDGFNNVANSNTQIYTTCAVPSDDVFPHHQAVSMSVHVYDATSSGQVSVYTCVIFNGAFGGLCGTGVSTTNAFTGVSVLSPPMSVLQTHEFDFPHVWGMVPGYGSSIKGFFMRDW